MKVRFILHKKILDQAIHSLVNALEDTYTTLGDINHFLGVIPEDVAIPVQLSLSVVILTRLYQSFLQM